MIVMSILLGKRELSDMEKLWEFLDAELDERLNIELDDNSIEKVRPLCSMVLRCKIKFLH